MMNGSGYYFTFLVELIIMNSAQQKKLATYRKGIASMMKVSGYYFNYFSITNLLL